METIYNAIIARFEAEKNRFNGAKTPFMDVYMGQPLNPEEFEFTLPAVFIDYGIDWGQELLRIEAHVVSDFGWETDNKSLKRAEGLEYLRLLALVRRLIKGVRTAGTGQLRPRSETPRTTDYYHYHVLSFEASITDTFGEEFADLTETQITPTLTPHQIKPTPPTKPMPEIPIYNQ